MDEEEEENPRLEGVGDILKKARNVKNEGQYMMEAKIFFKN